MARPLVYTIKRGIMNSGAQAKLAELHRKTDRQLAALVARRIECARNASDCAEIRPLLRLLPHGERRPLERRLEELCDQMQPSVSAA